MNIDVPGIIDSFVTVGLVGHFIHYFVFRGEDKQWKKDVNTKIIEMSATIDKLQNIDTNQQLGNQKLDQLIKLYENHVKTDEDQFKLIGTKLDGMTREVIAVLGKLAEK